MTDATLRTLHPTPEWQPRPYRCKVEGHDGGRMVVTVNATGKADAEGLAREKARDLGMDVAAVLWARPIEQPVPNGAAGEPQTTAVGPVHETKGPATSEAHL